MSDHVTSLLCITLDLQSKQPPHGLPAPSWSLCTALQPTLVFHQPPAAPAFLLFLRHTSFHPPQSLHTISPAWNASPGSICKSQLHMIRAYVPMSPPYFMQIPSLFSHHSLSLYVFHSTYHYVKLHSHFIYFFIICLCSQTLKRPCLSWS